MRQRTITVLTVIFIIHFDPHIHSLEKVKRQQRVISESETLISVHIIYHISSLSLSLIADGGQLTVATNAPSFVAALGGTSLKSEKQTFGPSIIALAASLDAFISTIAKSISFCSSKS